MDSKRQLKFARLIQRDLGELFQREFKHIFGQAFITVKSVEISPDLSVAKVYLSLMMVNDKAAFMKLIRENTKVIRTALAQRIKHQVRVIPALNFFLDESVDYAMNMDNIIRNLEIPKETPLNEDDYTDLEEK
ncbi:MAG: hypothetical protein RLZZ175_2504 [Bacteroidota bacterium]|jgi:ribosome-binding factor A